MNEFAPEFTQEWYQVSVDEGRIYDHLIKLEATDKDCTAKYSEICRYEITNNATPFAIDATGKIAKMIKINCSIFLICRSYQKRRASELDRFTKSHINCSGT